MALLQEFADIGLIEISDLALSALHKIEINVGLNKNAELTLTSEEQAALDELRAQFMDEDMCRRFRQILMSLGILGCAVSRRIKAVGAALGLTDEQMKDCLSDPPAPPDAGPQVYYLPPEPGIFHRVSLPPPPEDGEEFCGAPAAITAPEDALCPTDTHTGCNEPDGEDTDDLEDPSDCDTAEAMLNDIAQFFPEPALLPVEEQFTPPGATEIGIPLPNIPEEFPTEEEETGVQREFEPLSGQRPIYTARTYLEALYGAINLHDHPKLAGCQQVQDLSETLIERINNEIMLLPPGYISPNLLPKGFTTPGIPDVRAPRYRFAGLSDQAATKARRTAASARRRARNRLEA